MTKMTVRGKEVPFLCQWRCEMETAMLATLFDLCSQISSIFFVKMVVILTGLPSPVPMVEEEVCNIVIAYPDI